MTRMSQEELTKAEKADNTNKTRITETHTSACHFFSVLEFIFFARDAVNQKLNSFILGLEKTFITIFSLAHLRVCFSCVKNNCTFVSSLR